MINVNVERNSDVQIIVCKGNSQWEHPCVKNWRTEQMVFTCLTSNRLMLAFILKHSITETLAGLLTFSPTLLSIKNVSMQISILSANWFKSLISADHTAHFFSTWNFWLDNGPGNSDVWQQYANWMIDWNYFTIQLISMLANCWRSFHITLEKLIHWTPRPLLAFQT